MPIPKMDNGGNHVVQRTLRKLSLRLAAMAVIVIAVIVTSTDVARAAQDLPSPSVATSQAEISTRRGEIDRLIRAHQVSDAFMGSVLVSIAHQIVLNEGYGFANLEWKVPNSATTKFRIGSLTKQFTAAAVLLLEEQGRLRLDAPIASYLPDVPSSWRGITSFHLLTHTSGIPNFTALPDVQSIVVRTDAAVADILRLVRDKPLDFPPGEAMRYSNTGYILLGLVIERISGQTYEQFLQDHVFARLAMRDSGFDSNSTVVANRASGYDSRQGGFRNALYLNMALPHAAGALYSTTGDLLRWVAGLFNGQLLTQASVRKMITPFKNDYAFGVVVKKQGGRTSVEHAGGINGFNSYLAYYPDEKITIVVLSNVNGRTPETIAGEILPLLAP